MKIVSSLSKIYQDQLQINQLLANEVDLICNSLRDSQWHYVSRVKSEESFAQKIESGRYDFPDKLEDFFACTFVVENLSRINHVRALFKPHFNVVYERPRNPKHTYKDSWSFPFDYLRLYATLKPAHRSLKGPIHDVIFEIQIKTFLQHAWTVATHDLVYKADDISWVRERVAYQVKAMLESAEISIDGATRIKKINGLPESNDMVERQKAARSFFTKNWSATLLPKDLTSLVKNLDTFLRATGVQLTELENILVAEIALGKGSKTLSLSPYLVVIQSIVNQKPSIIARYITARKKKSSLPKLFIPKEIHLPVTPTLDTNHIIRT